MTSLQKRLSAAVLALGAALSLASCGDGPSEAAAAAESKARPADFLITSADLPDGWRDSNSQGIDYRVSVCGVDLEPQHPAKATSIRFSQGPLGPFLEQHVRVYDRDVTSEVIAGLRKALPGCTTYDATGTAAGSPTATFSVEPLTVKGAPTDSVSWRQSTDAGLPVTSDLLLVRRGDTAVLLMSYAVRGTPDPAVLERAAAALPEGP